MIGVARAALETLPISNVYGLIAGVFLLSGLTNIVWMRRWLKRDGGNFIAVLNGLSATLALVVGVQFALWAYQRAFLYLRISEPPITAMLLLLLFASITRIATIFYEDRQVARFERLQARYVNQRRSLD